MRRLFGIVLASLVVGLFMSSGAMAQGRGGRGGFGGGGFGGGGFAGLLQIAQVQKELKLSDDQIAKVKEVADAARPPQGTGGRRGADQTDEQRAAAREERQKRNAETDAKLTALLMPEQVTRLKQVQLWVQGYGALTNNEAVVKELGLTDDQKAALKTISDEAGRKRQALFQGLGRGASDEQRAKFREDSAALQKDTDAECKAVLTDDQSAKLAAMKGEKFELDMSQIAAGRGRRRGNNNNN